MKSRSIESGESRSFVHTRRMESSKAYCIMAGQALQGTFVVSRIEQYLKTWDVPVMHSIVQWTSMRCIEAFQETKGLNYILFTCMGRIRLAS
jgi:hypothetical protein